MIGVVDRVAGVGAGDREDELTALRRQTLNLATAAIAALALLWIAVYALLGLWAAAAVPLTWSVVTAVLLTAQVHHPHPAAFRTIELSMMLVFPFVLQWILGGFAASSAVGLWSLTAPLGAVFFVGGRRSVPWFAGFLALLVVSALIEPELGTPAEIPDGLQLAFFAINIATVSATVFLLVQYFVQARELEHERSESLLLNVLPAKVARRLKRSSGVIADHHPEASVLFADIVGFTQLTERLEPDRLVSLLDRIFTGWDELAARHGLEKIKTVGDEYMAAAGVPEARSGHADAAARMALEMPAALNGCVGPDTGPLQVRVGIDSGPVIAGVIGTTKFIYDLWGDTVNTASRMESSGEPGRVQVTERTAALLSPGFGLQGRGEITVKGKGPMRTFLLTAADEPQTPAGRDGGGSPITAKRPCDRGPS